jgi:hypothetical protein
MHLSFAQMWEQIEKDKARPSPLMSSGEDDRAMSVIRAGKDMRKEGDTPFWDDFITLCNNVDGLAQLLGVDRHVVSSWPGKIQEGMEKYEKHLSMHPEEDDSKDEMMPTGDNGAFTTNQDPMNNIGDVS